MTPSNQVKLIDKHCLKEDTEFNERIENEESIKAMNNVAKAVASLLDFV